MPCPHCTINIFHPSGTSSMNPHYTQFHPNRFHSVPPEIFRRVGFKLLRFIEHTCGFIADVPYLASLCAMTLRREETEQCSTPENKIPHLLCMVEENQLICPVNYSAHEGDVELVQQYASVDARKYLEPDVTRDPFVVWTGLKYARFGGGMQGLPSVCFYIIYY